MQVERLRSRGAIRVELHRTPVSGVDRAVELPADERLTLTELLERAEWRRLPERTRILVQGWGEAPRALWGHLRPHAGTRVVVVGQPADPATLTAIGTFFASLGSAVAAAVPGAGAIGGLAAQAGVGLGVVSPLGAGVSAAYVGGTILGGAAIVAGVSALGASLMDPPSQDLGRAPGQASPTLQGEPNTARRNHPYPYVLGDIQCVPPFGALPASIVTGIESEALYLFVLGPGPLEIDAADVRMGEVPVTSFSGVELAIREGTASDPPLSIYTNRIFQTPLNNVTTPLQFGSTTGFGVWVQTPVAGSGHRKLGVDFNCVSGLGRYSNSSRVQIYHVGFQIQYRVNGGSWITATTLSSFTKVGTSRQGSPQVRSVRGNSVNVVHFQGSDFKPFQIGFLWDVNGSPGDVFDIRIRRCETIQRSYLPGGPGSTAVSGQFVWYAAKGINFESPPILDSGIATIEMRTPVNEQFRGLAGNFSCRARRKARIYDPSAPGGADADGWSIASLETRNCAALIRDVLQGPGNLQPRTDDQIDVEGLTDFYVWCRDFDDGGSGPLSFDLFVDFGQSSQEDLCRTIAAAGLGRFGKDSQGRYTVIFDGPKTNPVALVNAANLRGFSMDVLFPPEVHGIRAQFVDRDHGYEPESERIVYNDGYDEDNADPGKLETIRFTGVTDPDLIYVHARRRLAESKLRRRVMSGEMYLEHLAFGVGDLVSFSHPGALVGAHWGRVKSVSSARYRDALDSDPAPYAQLARAVSGCTLEIGITDLGATTGHRAARQISTGTARASWSQQLKATQDWSGLRVRVDAKPISAAALSASDGLRIRVSGPTSNDWAEWRFGTSQGLAAGAWATASAALGVDAPFLTAGTFDPAFAYRVEFSTNLVDAQTGRVWGFDNFRADSSGSEVSEIVLDQPIDLLQSVAPTMDHRRVDAGSASLQIQTLDLRPISQFTNDDRTVPQVFLANVISGSNKPSAGDLVTVGLSARMICHSKESSSDLTASVTFVDEAPGIQLSATEIPEFNPDVQIPVPLAQLGPAKPIVRSIVSDERAMLRAPSGELRLGILISVEPGSRNARPPTDGYAVRYRRVGVTSYVALPSVGLSTQIRIPDVVQGSTYDIVIIALDALGRSSEPVTTQTTVVGNLAPPPDVQDFRSEGSLLRWSIDNQPADVVGFEIRIGSLDSTFSTARVVHESPLISAPPFEISKLPQRVAKFHIKAVDAGGRRSVNATSIEVFVGGPPEQNLVDEYDVAAAGFPIIDQISVVALGFEGVFPKEVPDGDLEIVYEDEDGLGDVLTVEALGAEIVTTESVIPLVGTRSLRVTA